MGWPRWRLPARPASPPPHTLRRGGVPADFPTIQDAVDGALPGDQIRVGPGEWCGATIDKTLDLFAEGGATIIGCPDPAPALRGFLRIGFSIPTVDASGTTIRHFVFDGAGVSDELPAGNFDPLSFAIFARDAHNIIVEQNRVLGTVQAITNTRGSGWTVNHNVIEDLTVFTCSGVDPCGGGVGIVFQDRGAVGPRQTDNTASFNVITGLVPDALQLFDMVGILILGAEEGTIIQKNRISIPANPALGGQGIGILVSDSCCGDPTPFSTAINSIITKNDGRGSELSVVIVLDGGDGMGNTVGTVLRGNFGINQINDVTSDVTSRSIHTLVEFP